MITPELAAFIRRQIADGKSVEVIRQQLLDAGWEANTVHIALEGVEPRVGAKTQKKERGLKVARDVSVLLVLIVVFLGIWNNSVQPISIVQKGIELATTTYRQIRKEGTDLLPETTADFLVKRSQSPDTSPAIKRPFSLGETTVGSTTNWPVASDTTRKISLRYPETYTLNQATPDTALKEITSPNTKVRILIASPDRTGESMVTGLRKDTYTNSVASSSLNGLSVTTVEWNDAKVYRLESTFDRESTPFSIITLITSLDSFSNEEVAGLRNQHYTLLTTITNTRD